MRCFAPPVLSLCGLLLLGLSTGCHSADASAWNLREVHDSAGGYDRRSAPMGHLEFNLRSAFDALGGGWVERNLGLEGKPERILERPDETARRELLRLAKTEGSSPRLRGSRVEFGAWLVVDSPSAVVRERAALMLLDEARSLGGVTVQQEPDEDALDAEGMTALVESLFAACDGGGDLELGRVLGQIESVTLDRDGAVRLQRAMNVQLRQPSRIAPAKERFLAVHEELRRRACALGLGSALRDVNDTVQAPAVRAVWDVEPEQGLELYIQALERGLPRVLETLGHGVRADGLPPEQRSGKALLVWFEALIRATDAPDGPAAVAAARALQSLAPEAEAFLRHEDWVNWWGKTGRARAIAGDVEQVGS